MAAPIAPLVHNFEQRVGSTEPFFFATQPTPPAKLEYLRKLDLTVLGAVTTPYASTGVTFHASEASGTAWYCFQVYAPGTHAARLWATMCWGIDSGVVSNAEFRNQTTNPPTFDRIDIPAPVKDGTDATTITETAKVIAGSDAYDNAPTADGTERLMEVTAAKAPVVEEIRMDNCFGFTTRPTQVLDMAAI